MATTTKEKNMTIQDIMPLLEKFALLAESVKPRSNEKLIEQLVVKNKSSAEKKAILKRLDMVTLLCETMRQPLVAEKFEETRQKTVKNLERLVLDGTLIKARELIERLGWTRQALSKARKELRLFSVEIKGEPYYPAFFADPHYERRQLEAVSKVLGDLPGTSKLQFMLMPKGSLDSLTPLEALAKGKVADVKISAKGFVSR